MAGEWECPKCGFINTRNWGKCKKCKFSRPRGEELEQAAQQAQLQLSLPPEEREQQRKQAAENRQLREKQKILQAIRERDEKVPNVRWEYSILSTFPTRSKSDIPTRAFLTFLSDSHQIKLDTHMLWEVIAELGQHGWELVHVVRNREHSFVLRDDVTWWEQGIGSDLERSYTFFDAPYDFQTYTTGLVFVFKRPIS